MMNIKGTILLGVVALSVVLTAATSAESNKKPDLPMDTIRAQQNQETVLNEAKDGLEFTVTLNKARFTLQDEIKVHVKVTNVSDKEIHSFAGVAAYGSVSVGISDTGKAFHLAYKPSKYDLPADQVVSEGNLQPGASIEYERVLFPKIDLYGESIDAWSGTYLISSGLTRNPGDTVEVSFPITIESNAKKIILPEDAEKTAYGSEEYKSWFAAHSGKSVAWIEGGQPYIVIKGEFMKADKAFYEKVLAESEAPNKITSFKNGNWVFNSTSYYGKEPMCISINVDAVNGNIVFIE